MKVGKKKQRVKNDSSEAGEEECEGNEREK